MVVIWGVNTRYITNDASLFDFDVFLHCTNQKPKSFKMWVQMNDMQDDRFCEVKVKVLSLEMR